MSPDPIGPPPTGAAWAPRPGRRSLGAISGREAATGPDEVHPWHWEPNPDPELDAVRATAGWGILVALVDRSALAAMLTLLAVAAIGKAIGLPVWLIGAAVTAAANLVGVGIGYRLGHRIGRETRR